MIRQIVRTFRNSSTSTVIAINVFSPILKLEISSKIFDLHDYNASNDIGNHMIFIDIDCLVRNRL